ncbi:Histidine kinase [Azospirillaceae bacterium]
MKKSFRNSLSFRQAISTFLLSLLFGLSFTAIEMLRDLRSYLENMTGTISSITKAVESSSSDAAFHLDHSAAEAVLDGLMNYHPVHYAVLSDEHKKPLAERVHPLVNDEFRTLSNLLFGETVHYVLPLYHNRFTSPEGRVQVGFLSIVLDTYLCAVEFMNHAQRRIFSRVVFNLLLSLTLPLIFYFMLIRPILTISKSLSCIHPDGVGSNLLLIPKGHEQDELGFLVKRINGIMNAYQLLIQQRDISNDELISARQRAEESNHAKSQFLSTISHELRTPLNAIIGFSQIIHEESSNHEGSAHHADFASEILSSGQQLLAIINEILDLTHLDTGHMPLAPEVIETSRVFSSIQKQITPIAEKSNITIEIDPLSEKTTVFADPKALHRILFNLLSNAIKFTPEDGHVTLSARNAPEGTLITVTDSGIGIAPDDLLRVFQPFWQAAPALSRTHQGAGLGLTLVKALAERHNGWVSISSQQGCGVTATVLFPHQQHDMRLLNKN